MTPPEKMLRIIFSSVLYQIIFQCRNNSHPRHVSGNHFLVVVGRFVYLKSNSAIFRSFSSKDAYEKDF